MTSLEDRLYEALGRDWCGNINPPGDHLRVQLNCDYLAATSNDGFELWIGTESEWRWSCGSEEARKLAWFILWDWWARGTWFGLRRAVWYWLLSRRIARNSGRKP